MQHPPSQNAGGPGSELRSDAQQLGNKAADRLHGEVDARKGAAVDQAKSVSSAIERAAGQLDDSAPTWLKSAFQQGAQQVQRFADAIDQKDSRQLMNDAQNFARERPGAFLAACAAAGFAAARIFKAGGEQQGGRQFGSGSQFGSSSGQSQPWGNESDSLSGQQGGGAQSFGQSGESFGNSSGTGGSAFQSSTTTGGDQRTESRESSYDPA